LLASKSVNRRSIQSRRCGVLSRDFTILTYPGEVFTKAAIMVGDFSPDSSNDLIAEAFDLKLSVTDNKLARRGAFVKFTQVTL
jgi:hypothetical protein